LMTGVIVLSKAGGARSNGKRDQGEAGQSVHTFVS